MSDLKQAGSVGFPPRPRMSRIEFLRHTNEIDRQKNPHLYFGTGHGDKWLYIENVAAIFGTSKDYVYRLSREELPAARTGKRLVYAREHVDAFIMKRMETSTRRYVADRKSRVVPSKKVGDVAADEKSFDPIAMIRNLKGGK